MRAPSYAWKKINKIKIPVSWEDGSEWYWMEMARTFLDCNKNIAKAKNGPKQQEVARWFRNHQSWRKRFSYWTNVEVEAKMVWLAFHYGYRCGMKKAGAKDDKVEGFPFGGKNPKQESAK